MNVGELQVGNTSTENNTGQGVTYEEAVGIQVNSNTDTLSVHEVSKSTKEKVKKLTVSSEFEDVCLMAMTDPAACASRLALLVDGDLDAMVEFANVCVTGLVGHVGTRQQMKAVAGHLLDSVLAKNDDHILGLCAKGEWLMPKNFFGVIDSDTPIWLLEEAYEYFFKADKLGSREGRFLRGRWLVMMNSHHKSKTKTSQGRAFVEQAANAGHARAHVFLGQCLEFAGKFGWSAKKGPVDKKNVIKYYRKAAELGNGDAMNDMGSSYATGYGGLPYDFDMAVSYYVGAIKAGCLTGFDNLGTHYESGMSGRAIERIDYSKAMHYYRQGARLRCSKCAYNIAAAYEEGMGDGVVKRNPVSAERYYRYCIVLAEDENDAPMANRALKDLVSLYITRIKTNQGDKCVDVTRKKLRLWLSERMLVGTLNDVDKCLFRAMKSGDDSTCTRLLGDCNGSVVYQAAKIVFKEALKCVKENGRISVGCRGRMKHMFGKFDKDVFEICRNLANSNKRRKIGD